MRRQSIAALLTLGFTSGVFFAVPAHARVPHGAHLGFRNPGLGALNYGLGSPVFGNCGRNIPVFDPYYGYDPCGHYLRHRFLTVPVSVKG